MSLNICILSPHIDDAAYGLALTISQCVNNQIPVTIINCFTVTQWTAVPVATKEITEVSLLRKTEDAAFYKALKGPVSIINLDLLDAPLRNGYIWQNKPFEPNEKDLVEELKDLLELHVDGLLLCPLGIGNHIDHAICRAAVLKLYKKVNVLFYEDLPYARRISEEQIRMHIKNLEEELGVRMSNRIDGLLNCCINKEQAIRVYKSQINDEICAEIIAHMNGLAGERIWGEVELINGLKSLLHC